MKQIIKSGIALLLEVIITRAREAWNKRQADKKNRVRIRTMARAAAMRVKQRASQEAKTRPSGQGRWK